MRRAAPAGVLLCSIASVLLIGCGEDTPTSRTINVGGEPRRLGFSEQGKIGAIANMAGYLTFVR